MYPPIVTPYLVGVATAPLVVKILRPIVRGAVRAGAILAAEAKTAAAETSKQYLDLVADASADFATQSRLATEAAVGNKEKSGRGRPGTHGARRGAGADTEE